MIVKKQSSNYDVLDYGTIILFDEKSNFVLYVDTEDNFKFQVTIDFSDDNSGQKFIDTKTKNNEIKMTCMNFLSSGTGTSVPIEIATWKSKKIYLSFWVYIEGDVEGAGKTRSIKYTLFIEG